MPELFTLVRGSLRPEEEKALDQAIKDLISTACETHTTRNLDLWGRRDVPHARYNPRAFRLTTYY